MEKLTVPNSYRLLMIENAVAIYQQKGNNITGPSNLNEILKNYRDRAEERRKGIGKDDNIDDLHANNAYRAVPGDVRATADAAQRRKQAIQVLYYLISCQVSGNFRGLLARIFIFIIDMRKLSLMVSSNECKE